MKVEDYTLDDQKLYAITNKAILVGEENCDEEEKVWIPKSKIIESSLDFDDDESVNMVGYFVVPLWLAEREGLV